MTDARKQTSRRNATPLGRGMGFERWLISVLGLLALLAGLAGLVVGAGWLGTFRAQRPILDPVVSGWVQGAGGLAIPVAIVVGIVLLGLGLWWLRRALRPETKPDMRLDRGPGGSAIVTAHAVTQAVRADAETVSGVSRARARMAGNSWQPGLRLTLSMEEDANLRRAWEELDTKVLSRARQALDTDPMPTTIRLDLERFPHQRVE